MAGISAKDVRQLVRAAEKQGWTWKQTKKGHVQCKAPNGTGIVTISGTPSDPHSLRNAISQMRSEGFVWPSR